MKIRYAKVDYNYVHRELKKTGVTLKLLWEEYSDKCFDEGVKPCSYITFTKNYNKYTADKNYTSHVEHKPGVEGAVGDVATAIIARLRNEIFTSLSGLNAGILRAPEAFNDKPFQKRFGSRSLIFENEEKPLLRALPMVP